MDPNSYLHRLSAYSLEWNTPSTGSRESMPLGNGEVGVNLWVEADGCVHLYVARTDAWGENGQLFKVGKLVVRLFSEDGSPLTDLVAHRLELPEGSQKIVYGGSADVELEWWVDASKPLIYGAVRSSREIGVEVSAELMRPVRRHYTGREIIAAQGLEKEAEPPMIEADQWVSSPAGMCCWAHENTYSMWRQNLAQQEVPEWAERGEDPLLGRIFGGIMGGEGWEEKEPGTLVRRPGTTHFLCIPVLTTHGDSMEAWKEQAIELLGAGTGQMEASREQTRAWWADFWQKSYFFAEGTAEGRELTRGYYYQKFLLAAAGRGNYPVKFNGSLFTADWEMQGEAYNADYRRWGGGYWFQNTRLIYWAMPPMGMRDFMEPFFRLYRGILPFCEYRCREYYGHPGAFFPETMHFWGGYLNTNYGYDREGLDKGVTENRYIRYYHCGAIELLMLALEANRYQPDAGFAGDIIQPFAEKFLAFYACHYPRREDGRLHLTPAQSLETYQDAEDPAPEIAGLMRVIPLLLEQGIAVDPEQEDEWKALLDSLPPLPRDEDKLLPASRIFEKANNIENPELYAVFPYRLYGVGKPELERARRTYSSRVFVRELGWHQDPIQAACLGLATEAFNRAHRCLSTPYSKARFPGFWGPNYDWIPDQDQGSVGLITVHSMLLQGETGELLLFPAWPEGMDCDFKLCAPGGLTVQGKLEDGVATYTVDNPKNAPVEVRSFI